MTAGQGVNAAFGVRPCWTLNSFQSPPQVLTANTAASNVAAAFSPSFLEFYFKSTWRNHYVRN